MEEDRRQPAAALPGVADARRGVNLGWHLAATWPQKAVGMAADGEIGDETLNALKKPDGRGLLRAKLAIQDKREAYERAQPDYLHGHPFGVRFLAGWLNRAQLRHLLTAGFFEAATKRLPEDTD